MIKREFYETRKDSVNLYKTYREKNKIIRQIETGNEYDEAIDVGDENGFIKYSYIETEKDIERSETNEIE